MAAEESPRASSVLVVDDDELVIRLAERALATEGFDVVTAMSGAQALERVSEAVPDVIVSDVNMPDLDGFELVSALRADRVGRSVPFIFMTTRSGSEDVVAGLSLGADDYITKPFRMEELVARVRARVDRPPVPADLVPIDIRTGLRSQRQLLDHAAREAGRARRSGRPGQLAVIALDEIPVLEARLGRRAVDVLARQVAAMLLDDAGPLEEAGRDSRGRFLLLMPETTGADATRRLTVLADAIVAHTFSVDAERLRVTPVIGFASLDGALEDRPEELLERASIALEHAALHLDLRPVAFVPEMTRPSAAAAGPPLSERLRTPLQIAVTFVAGVVLPFLVYLGLGAAGHDISTVAYLVVVVALVVTASSIWLEGFLALSPRQPPAEPGAPAPPASAVIAAYLPNEAATVVETIEAFLRVEYDGPLQVILAYNTPRRLPIEGVLAEIARQDPRFVPLEVKGSTSKAQNVNAALAHVRGEFVGIFDADHLPDPDSYTRAWRWLSNGYDVVQGHAVVRNGAASVTARTVAVEFESIYAISHPGRTRLHGFGIFGGSNGYWRTDLLRATRMRGSMLTEDIDSSLRAVERGYRIASDPLLVSRELAPTVWRALWNQRMRWAQGWFQVSLRHLKQSLASPHLSVRQKAGFLFLLAWREAYPWVSLQMFPIIAYLAVREGGVNRLDWAVPVFVLTTVFTLSVGPGQALFAYLRGHESVKEHRSWFWWYLIIASVFYTEYKNIIARVAQVKELMGERAWKVTPRSVTTAPDTATALLGAAGPASSSAAQPFDDDPSPLPAK